VVDYSWAEEGESFGADILNEVLMNYPPFKESGFSATTEIKSGTVYKLIIFDLSI
jgi:hypothetical protein